MTPEALHAYLTACRFSEDAVQATVCRYLVDRPKVRHPKAWGFIAARNHDIALARHLGVRIKTRHEVARMQTPIRRTPEQVAAARQAISRAVKGQKGGVWWEDYQVLLNEQP